MSLREAVFKIQGMVSSVGKDGFNPHTKKNYATLESVLDALNGPLQDHQLTVTQTTRLTEAQWVLVTTIRLTSKDENECFDTPLLGLGTGANAMQALGSAITYARRYALMSYFKLAPTDDDGSTAAPNQSGLDFVKGKRKEEPKAKPKGATVTDLKIGEGKYKGLKVSEVPAEELRAYITEIDGLVTAAGKKHPKWFAELKLAVGG